MKKGTKVTLFIDINHEWIDGITIEDECIDTSNNLVIRVRWNDRSESIERVSDLSVI